MNEWAPLSYSVEFSSPTDNQKAQHTLLSFHLCFIIGKYEMLPNLISLPFFFFSSFPKTSHITTVNTVSTKQCSLPARDKRSFGRDVPLRTYKGFVLTPVLKEEAYLSKGRMPTLNKEMSLQDVHMLLSINDKQSLQKSNRLLQLWQKLSSCGLPVKDFKINILQINVLYLFSKADLCMNNGD